MAKAIAEIERRREKQLAREIKRLEKAMQDHAKNLEFEQAVAARDELRRLEAMVLGHAAKDV